MFSNHVCLLTQYKLDDLHGNGNTTNEQDKQVVNTSAVVVTESRILNQNNKDKEDKNGTNTEVTNLCKNDL